LRAPAFFVVDAAWHISPIFDIIVRISLFFLCCLVDVSISRSQYSCGFLRLGWTLQLARKRGVEPSKCRHRGRKPASVSSACLAEVDQNRSGEVNAHSNHQNLVRQKDVLRKF
jgi:hypothetical protein